MNMKKCKVLSPSRGDNWILYVQHANVRYIVARVLVRPSLRPDAWRSTDDGAIKYGYANIVSLCPATNKMNKNLQLRANKYSVFYLSSFINNLPCPSYMVISCSSRPTAGRPAISSMNEKYLVYMRRRRYPVQEKPIEPYICSAAVDRNDYNWTYLEIE